MNRDVIERFLRAPLSGRDYCMIGVCLVGTKFLLDTLLSMVFLERPWTPWGYFAPGRVAGSPEAEWSFFLAMLAMALPFIAVGVVLTVRRLHTLGLDLWLTILFFVPFVNLIFFAVLSIAPTPAAERPSPPATPVPVEPLRGHATRLEYGHDDTGKPATLLGRILSGRRSSYFASILIPQPFAIGATLLSVYGLHSYGWGVFVGLPFVLPMLSVILYGYAEEQPIGSNLGVGVLSMLAYALCLMFLSLEGAICIIMAMPLAIPVAMMGAAVGHAVQRSVLRGVSRIPLALLVILPALMGAERVARLAAPVYAVRTSVEVDAPPEVVWRHVVSFPELPPPREMIFRAGIAYPIRASITGTGPGAVRHCVFSTGAFVEPITVWEEGRLLKFDVTECPRPLTEWTLFDGVEPPHLEHFLVSRGGEFRLVELEGGRTRLEGTTWYQHHMWPAGYWRVWSDAIIHKIHLRVLGHVKGLAEGGAGLMSDGSQRGHRRNVILNGAGTPAK